MDMADIVVIDLDTQEFNSPFRDYSELPNEVVRAYIIIMIVIQFYSEHCSKVNWKSVSLCWVTA